MNAPADFQHLSSRCKVISGLGALDSLAAEAATVGAHRLMLVSGTRSAQGAAARAVR